jgi:hypothetical protein
VEGGRRRPTDVGADLAKGEAANIGGVNDDRGAMTRGQDVAEFAEAGHASDGVGGEGTIAVAARTTVGADADVPCCGTERGRAAG